MITFAPLPNLYYLALSLFIFNQDICELSHKWKRSNNAIFFWFSRSAFSLALIVEYRKKIFNKADVCVWLPDYFCNSAIAPLRSLGATLHFYKIDEALKPCFDDIKKYKDILTPDIFILTHYFGIPKDDSKVREFCKVAGAWLVEDATHALMPTSNIGEQGDFVMYSPHKTLPQPDGAILIVRTKGPSEIDPNCEIVLSRLVKDIEINLGLKNKIIMKAFQNIYWTLKRVLQKFGIYQFKRLSFVDYSTYEYPISQRISRLSKILLSLAGKSILNVKYWRTINQIVLDEIICSAPILTLKPGWRHPESYTPYNASYRSQNAAIIYDALQDSKILCNAWPDLPPEVINNPRRHSTAIRLRNTTIFFPIHQSIRPNQLLQTFDQFSHVQIIKDITIKWNNLNEFEWDELMANSPHTNLMQSWTYGNAKYKSSAWNVNRAVFVHRGSIIGYTQVLQKKFIFGLITLSRINRGPIYLQGASNEEKMGCYSLIKKEMAEWKKFKILLWAPELKLTVDNLSPIYRAGLKINSLLPNWKSSILNLTLDEELLYKNLRANWRHSLKLAQKSSITLCIDNSKKTFDVLLNNCSEMMSARGISFPKELYQNLYKIRNDHSKDGFLLTAKVGAELVAATWSVTHGTTATYLLGWINDRGKRIGAHHLLLWKTAMLLKGNSYSHFDLGGINEQSLDGISSFKLGMGGSSYSLIGEGILL